MVMKIIFIGSKRSDCIIKASKYLAEKYLPQFEKIYLKFDRDLEYWSVYLSGFLAALPVENIILGMDDFLIAAPINIQVYLDALKEMGGDVVCIKLCKSTEEEHEQYPVTTQLSIWNREYLIDLLENTNSPWNFERAGSKMFGKKSLLRTCIDYNCNSATSGRWEGYKLDGLKEEDVLFLKENGYLE